MNKREIASLACKVLGIYLVIQGINVMGSIFSVFITNPDQQDPGNLINIIFPFSSLFVFGVLLWLFSDKFSAFMIKGGTHANNGLDVKASDIERISFSVLGLFFLGNSLPKLVSTLTNMYSMSGLWMPILLESGAAITEFIIGIGIFLGSQGLVSFLSIVRTAGLSREEDKEEKE